MRSMSMIQLLGGVAVAGAVAAGTTAFTNSGVTMPTSQFIGGSAAIVPVGASVTGITPTWANSNTEISDFTVAFSGSSADGKTGTLVVTDATGNSGGGAPAFNCGAISSSSMTCTAASTYTVGTITNITVTVV